MNSYFITIQYITADHTLVEETDVINESTPEYAIEQIIENYRKGDTTIIIKSIQKI